MECLGFGDEEGVVYEGPTSLGIRMNPPPVVVPIDIPSLSATTWTSPPQGFAPRVFREDYFDPVTRIRRGRVFVLYGDSQPRDWWVFDPLLGPAKAGNKRLYYYVSDSLAELRKIKIGSSEAIAVLGREPFVDIWRIQSIEGSVRGAPYLTLKAHRSLSDLPEVDFSRVPEESKKALSESLEHVENANHRQGAVDVVDRCRAALTIVFGIYHNDRVSDLGKLISKAEKQDEPPRMACWAGGVVNRLHPRGKPNELHRLGTRSIDEGDAQLAISCLGLVIKEFGLAKPARF